MKKTLLLIGLVVSLAGCDPSSSAYNQLPKGAIIGWGSTDNIPKNWVVCNGANGTPNLLDKFPYGTVNSTEIGKSVGHPTHQHTVTGVTNIPEELTVYNGDNRALQKDGGERVHHKHLLTGQTSVDSLIPPGTKIIFIMKIK